MADIKQIILPDGNTYNLKDTVSAWVGTQDEYDAIQNPDPTVTYFITDSTPFPIPSANAIHYDHTSSELSASNVQDAIDEVVSGKADKIATGSHTVYGIWSNSFYGSCRLWVAFPNANQYTITITSAKYRSADTTMTAITSPSVIVQNDCGFLVNAPLTNIGNNYGEVVFTTT